MESGNIKTTLKNAYNRIFGSDIVKSIQNSSHMTILHDTAGNIKQHINTNRTYILFLILGTLIISLYFIFIFRRIPRYLSRLKVFKPLLNQRPLESFSFIKTKNYRLCDFYIASSYKSYLPCTNYYDYSSTCAI